MSSILTLFCCVRGDNANRIFSVDIKSSDYVADLKKSIKSENEITFRNLEAKALMLWKADIPVDENFAKNLKEFDYKQAPLSPVDKLSRIFSNLNEDHLHVVVDVQDTAHDVAVQALRNSHGVLFDLLRITVENERKWAEGDINNNDAELMLECNLASNPVISNIARQLSMKRIFGVFIITVSV